MAIVFQDKGGWRYKFDNRNSQVFPDRDSARRDYAQKFVNKNKKIKPLVEGKKWDEVFRILGI